MRNKLTFANVMSVIAVFIALGGVGYAAAHLPKNSVGSKQIKNNAVTGAKVADGSLTGADIGGPVGSASSADMANHAATAENANHAANSDALQGHAASDFLAANGTAADSSHLGGLNPSDYGDVESANINGLGPWSGSPQYGAISGFSTASGTERDSLSPNRAMQVRDFSIQLDAALPSGVANIYLGVNGFGPSQLVCQIGAGQTGCTNPGPISVPASSRLALGFTGSASVTATTAMVGFRLTPN